jgi:hypothetical protein
MTLLSFLKAYRQRQALKRVEAMRRPDPDYRDRMLAQFTPERRARYFDNIRKAGL